MAVPGRAAETAWRDALRERGVPVAGVLGAGMEGTVFDCGDGTVAKVWYHRDADELGRLKTFYEAILAAGFALEVPVILELLRLEELVVTRQVRCAGEPLWDRPGVSPPRDPRALDAVVGTLTALSEVPPAPDMAILPVLAGEQPFDPDRTFESCLAALVESRAARHRAALRRHLPDLDEVVGGLARHLRGLEPASPRLVHGDLVPGNIAVHDDRVSGLLDFGFLSTLGDPAFDAAVAGSVHDMFGPAASVTERWLDRELAEHFGHDPGRLYGYRAAYALVTSNCFSVSGSDGHFAWCVEMLRRPALRELLRG